MHALKFVQRVGECMCVTSPMVGQLYSNFKVEADLDKSELMIMPDFEKHLEIFDFIDAKALTRTNIVIMPRVVNGVEHLCIGHLNEEHNKFSWMPLAAGLQKIKQKNSHFLPVLNSREVRQWRPRSPLLQVYQLNLKALKDLSPFALRDIQNTINDKLSTLSHVA